jgi:putative transposase
MREVKRFYRRNLPHYQPENATLFVTFRIAASLPREVVLKIMEEESALECRLSKLADRSERIRLLNIQRKRYFERFDSLLDNQKTGPQWLRNHQVADMVSDAILYRDGNIYDLIAYCIMPNHIHMVFIVKRSDTSLYNILQSLKAYTARSANKILHREGAFWLHESYDHVVRNEKELKRIIWYVLNNPVKARIVKEWYEWPWLYCRPDMVEQFGGKLLADNVATDSE